MSMQILWGDDFTRLEPLAGASLESGESGWAPPVKIAGLKNSFASFQLTVGQLGKNQTVLLSATDLKGQGKAAIGARQYDIFVEWFVPQDGRHYPDVCVPQALAGGSSPAFRKLNGVADARYAGFWVDLFIPADAVAGDYQGKIVVRCGDERQEVPVLLSVANAALSADCCLDVSMNNYSDSISGGWAGLSDDPDRFSKARYQRVEQGVFRAAHEHRAFLHYLPYGHSGYITPSFAPPLAGEGPGRHVTDWSVWDRHFGKFFDGSAFKDTRRGATPVKRFYLPLNLCWPGDFVKFGQPGYEAEWRAVGAQMVSHFKSKRWTRTSFDMFPNHKQRFRFFPWDTEEARFPDDNNLHRYLAKLWQGTFDRATTAPVRFDYTLGTTWLFESDIRSDLTDFIDVFIGGGNDLRQSHDQMARLHKKGRQVWPCLSSGALADSTRAAAFPPLMVWMLDGDGYMPRWLSMDGWGERAWRGQAAEKGASTFLYCGAPLGSEDTFGALRLKVQRNALQMVDAFHLAAQRLPGGKQAVKNRINKALRISFKGWLPSRRPDPNDTDRFTEEPPLAGWQNFTAEHFRRLRVLAGALASGDK